nr:motility protein A [Thermotogota bacterium]
MDISTLLGLGMGFIVIALGLVSSGDMSVYLGKDSIMSLIIVLGGAIASVFVGFPKAKSMK